MFPELEAKIEEARKMGSPAVPMLLGYLSQAEQALHRGDESKAQYYVRIALETR